jgi:hypothetical protein
MPAPVNCIRSLGETIYDVSVSFPDFFSFSLSGTDSPAMSLIASQRSPRDRRALKPHRRTPAVADTSAL